MNESAKKSVFVYESVGMIFIIIFGSLLHFTFEWSGNQPIVGVFSAVNEARALETFNEYLNQTLTWVCW